MKGSEGGEEKKDQQGGYEEVKGRDASKKVISQGGHLGKGGQQGHEEIRSRPLEGMPAESL